MFSGQPFVLEDWWWLLFGLYVFVHDYCYLQNICATWYNYLLSFFCTQWYLLMNDRTFIICCSNAFVLFWNSDKMEYVLLVMCLSVIQCYSCYLMLIYLSVESQLLKCLNLSNWYDTPIFRYFVPCTVVAVSSVTRLPLSIIKKSLPASLLELLFPYYISFSLSQV